MLFALLSVGLLAGLVIDSSGSGDDDDGTAADVQSGGGGGDTLTGDAAEDLIFGNGGADDLAGAGADDVLAGGVGGDALAGQRGDDLLYGGNGDDSLTGGAGDDALLGGGGDDQVQGGAGDDRLLGLGGADTLDGGAGDDWIYGQDDPHDPDDLLGSSTEAQIGSRLGVVAPELIDRLFDESRSFGARAPDRLFGGAGADVLSGDAGDSLTGGAGIDRFDVIQSGPEVVELTDFNPDTETLHLVLDGATRFQQPDLVASGEDTLVQIDGITVAVLRGVLPGAIDAAGIVISGGDAEPDMQQGGPGDDVLTGVDGDDSLTGGGGDDTLAGLGGDDVAYGGAGEDSLSGGAASDQLYGLDGDDALAGGEDDDWLYGGRDDDVIHSGGGDDLMFGGQGEDTITHDGPGDATIYGDRGQDSIATHLGGADSVDGGSYGDLMIAGGGDTLTGGLGRDRFHVHLEAGEDDDTDSGVVRITDFVPGSETIRIFPVDLAEGEHYVLTLSDGPDGVVGTLSGDAAAAGEGVVLVLEGLRVADIDRGDFALHRVGAGPQGEIRFA